MEPRSGITARWPVVVCGTALLLGAGCSSGIPSRESPLLSTLGSWSGPLQLASNGAEAVAVQGEVVHRIGADRVEPLPGELTVTGVCALGPGQVVRVGVNHQGQGVVEAFDRDVVARQWTLPQALGPSVSTNSLVLGAHACAGTSLDDLWLLGETSSLVVRLAHWDGRAWSQEEPSVERGNGLFGLAVSRGHVWIEAGQAVYAREPGRAEVKKVESPKRCSLRAVDGSRVGVLCRDDQEHVVDGYLLDDSGGRTGFPLEGAVGGSPVLLDAAWGQDGRLWMVAIASDGEYDRLGDYHADWEHVLLFSQERPQDPPKEVGYFGIVPPGDSLVPARLALAGTVPLVSFGSNLLTLR